MAGPGEMIVRRTGAHPLPLSSSAWCQRALENALSPGSGPGEFAAPSIYRLANVTVTIPSRRGGPVARRSRPDAETERATKRPERTGDRESRAVRPSGAEAL